MTSPLDLTIPEMRDLLTAKKISAVELTRLSLERANKLKELNAFISLTESEALRAAEAADARLKKGESGALLGIPVAVKDVLTTVDAPTTCASKILKNFVAPYDATVVKKLREAGAVIVGKTNMDEFAMGSSNENSAFGPCKNPWNKGHVPGGSSGGSAAAVAARIVPMALGSDTGGSVRQPAAFCNIVGLKPSYGRISRYGLIAFASSLDQVGIFTKTAQESFEVLKLLAGRDPLDSTSAANPVPSYDVSSTSIKGLRIGIPKEYAVKGLDAEVQANVQAAIKKLEALGAKIVDISLPHTQAAVAAYYIIAPAEACSNLARYDGIRYGHRASGATSLAELYSKSRGEGFGEEVKRRIMIGTYVLSRGYYDAYYVKAQKVRTLIANDFNAAFADKCDVIACPTAPVTAFKIGDKITDPLAMYLTDAFTLPASLAGLPGISIPCGFSSANMPIGLQLLGKQFDEETIGKVANTYEQATEWTRRLAAI
jgi:aspartyl-tRNA(Asn)/glutamyl-tRNA(Gln) amidotransferase subunit A